MDLKSKAEKKMVDAQSLFRTTKVTQLERNCKAGKDAVLAV